MPHRRTTPTSTLKRKNIMKRFFLILIAIAICFAVGATAHHFQADALANWYPTLNKSSLTPPDWVFPYAWGLIYLLLGISFGLVWHRARFYFRNGVSGPFFLQLLLNFLWSITFFYLKSPLLGFINIILLDMAVYRYVLRAQRKNVVSAWLCAPYILWLALATYLNGYIMIHN